MLTRPQPKMKTQTHRNVSKFYKEFSRISIFILLICLLCFHAELSFGQKKGKGQNVPKEQQNKAQGESKKQNGKENKITICHDGKTKEIKEADLQKHLDHGDSEGACEAAPEEPEDENTNKVIICHEGMPLEISENALQAHLDHGDTEGPCSDGNLDGDILLSFNPLGVDYVIYENIGAELSALYYQFTEFGSVPSDDIFVKSGDRVLIEIIAEDAASLLIIIGALDDYDVEIFADYLNSTLRS